MSAMRKNKTFLGHRCGAVCGVQRCNGQHATRNVQRRQYKMHCRLRETCDTQHRPCALQKPCNTQHAACSMQPRGFHRNVAQHAWLHATETSTAAARHCDVRQGASHGPACMQRATLWPCNVQRSDRGTCDITSVQQHGIIGMQHATQARQHPTPIMQPCDIHHM
jgi:hypothetical protein